MYEKQKLYRKVNTTTWGVWHRTGGDAKNDRHTKKGIDSKMQHGVQRGLDYTPLYRFLLSKVGRNFDDVYSEAVARLDKPEPIFYILQNSKRCIHGKVIPNSDQNNGYVVIGKAVYSTMYVDDNGLLQLCDASLKNEDFVPSCPCCTYTFNGSRLINRYGEVGVILV